MAPLDRLKDTARDLVALTTGVPPHRLTASPGQGEWSAATVIAHLADAELVYGVRLRRVLTEDLPFLAGFDEGAWAARFGPLEDDPRQSLSRFRLLRELNLRILESAEEAEWARAAVHAERGELTLAGLAGLLVDHDRAHLDQIRRTLAATG